MSFVMSRIASLFRLKPLDKKQAEVLASIKFPCC